MKRPLEEDPAVDGESGGGRGEIWAKKGKAACRSEEETVEKGGSSASAATLGEDLLFEVLRHADTRTLGRAACVSRQWRRTADDERLWEAACTRHCANMGCGVRQLRSVVLALGGFRRLHSVYLLPLLNQPGNPSPLPPPLASSSSSSSLLAILPFSAAAPAPSPPPPAPSSSFVPASSSVQPKKAAARWGKDEVNLSLSLLSIQYYYEKMGMKSKGGGGRRGP